MLCCASWKNLFYLDSRWKPAFLRRFQLHSIKQPQLMLPLVRRTILQIPCGSRRKCHRHRPRTFSAIATAVKEAADATEGGCDDHAGGDDVQHGQYGQATADEEVNAEGYSGQHGAVDDKPSFGYVDERHQRLLHGRPQEFVVVLRDEE